jgi:hypothetical protein
MLEAQAFTDMTAYIKRRLGYARYRTGTVWTKTEITDISVTGKGQLRVKLNIPVSGKTVTRVELWNNESQLWASQECNIKVETEQTGILFWFDISISEEG